MNYGKFFRLNLKESKIVDGIAVYDYIDLPAFLESSSENPISPKYPITAVITKDSVRFRLHYCAYRVESKNENGKVIAVQYYYDPQVAFKCSGVDSPAQLVHMQEVILELPFSEGNNYSLPEVISKIYFTRFPQLTEFDADIDKDGYVNQLLEKRYRPDLWYQKDDKSIEAQSFKALQKNIDGDRSYSSIWLMDLRKTNEENEIQFVDLSLSESKQDKGSSKESVKKPKYVGFLRKLFLDFIFDLVHSDIFQSSAHYTEMLSGLKADFMFSALLHKCEYYYYRGLILDALESIELLPEFAKEGKKGEVKKLYAAQLLDAEKKWVEDIINPISDEVFLEPQDDFDDDWSSEKKRKAEQSSFRIYPYWFASPEEEMRRVCFSMSSSDTRKIHLCDIETLSYYLEQIETPRNKSVKEPLEQKEAPQNKSVTEALEQIIYGRLSTIKQLRTKISKWFFKRYDFDDAWRLHQHKGFAKAEFLFLLITIGLFIGEPQLVEQGFWEGSIGKPIAITLGSIIGLFTLVSGAFAFIWPLLRKKCKHKLVENSRIKDNRSILWSGRVTLAWRRVFWLSFITSISIGLILLGAADLEPIWKWIGLAVWAVFFVIVVKQTNVISNIHLLYPRLFASITAAWLSLAIGNELFSAFFDSTPSILACVSLATIVLVFIIYEINRHFPLISTGAKVWRSVQMLVYSYAISLLIGLFIINFTGREFLERSEYLPTFFEEYEETMNPQSERVTLLSAPTNDTTSIVSDTASDTLRIAVMAKAHSVFVTEGLSDTLRIAITAKAHKIDSTRLAPPRHHPQAVNQRHGYFRPKGVIPPPEKSNRQYFEQLENRKVPGKDHHIASIWRGVDGDPIFFILRDFLIQFAFLAMFIGVFIQMIFEEKSITEM